MSANAKLNTSYQKRRAREERHKRRWQEKAAKKLEIVKKRKINAVVRTGDCSLKIVLHPREEDLFPIGNLVAGTYLEKLQIERRLAQRSTHSLSVPMPSAQNMEDSSVRIVMKPRPGMRKGTRASSAVAEANSV